MSEWDEVRPFFGERSEPIGPPLPPISRPEETATPAMRYQWRLAEGLCGVTGCGGTIDCEGYCATCGNVSKPLPPEQEREFIPRLPGALRPDDPYAPAQIEDWDAA